MRAKVRIGISGWKYPGWRGVFYPRGLAQKRELEFAAREFPTIEINGTFYSLKRPNNSAEWARQTPEDFVFAVKGSRYITHMRRLREIEAPLANFFAQGLLRLAPKLGPILWQFPPNFSFDREGMEAFFRLLPRTIGDASRLAARHDRRLAGRSWFQAEKSQRKLPIRHCVEIRHDSFVIPEFIELLKQQNIGLVIADAVDWPLLMDVTSDFVYVRLHGSEDLYSSGYSDSALRTWAKRITAWMTRGSPPPGRYAAGKSTPRRALDVFVYFDNDAKVRAPFDARSLTGKVDRLLSRDP